MTGDEFREALERLGLKQTGPQGIDVLLDVGERTARRWINNGPPSSVVALVKLMIHLRLKPATVRRIFEAPLSRERKD